MQVLTFEELQELDLSNARDVALKMDPALFPGTAYGAILTVDQLQQGEVDPVSVPVQVAVELPPFLISLVCEQRLQGRLEARKILRQALGMHRWTVSIDSRPVYDSETKTIVEK